MVFLVMVLIVFLLTMRDIGPTKAGVITMDELVNTFTESLISWNTATYNGELGRGKRSVDGPHRQRQLEYVNVDCKLSCGIETQDGSHRKVLTCIPNSYGEVMKGTPIRTSCVEHTSGRLLHLILSIPNISADYLDSGFARAVSSALVAMTPEPETLYLTIEIPLLVLRQHDFTELSPKLRRLSLFLGQSIHVDRNVLMDLALESFALEGCLHKETRAFQNESRLCDVNLFYSCPKIGEFALAADKNGRKKLCPNLSDMHYIEEHIETQPVCSCMGYRTLIETIHHSLKKSMERDCALGPEYKQLLILSLVTNLILSCILLSISLFTVFLYVQNHQRSHRNKA